MLLAACCFVMSSALSMHNVLHQAFYDDIECILCSPYPLQVMHHTIGDTADLGQQMRAFKDFTCCQVTLGHWCFREHAIVPARNCVRQHIAALALCNVIMATLITMIETRKHVAMLNTDRSPLHLRFQQVSIRHKEDARRQVDLAISEALKHRKPAYIEVSCNLVRDTCACLGNTHELSTLKFHINCSCCIQCRSDTRMRRRTSGGATICDL